MARAAAAPPFDVSPFRLDVVDRTPWPGADPTRYPDRVAAAVRAEGGRLRVTHRRHLSELDLEMLEGRLWREGPDDGGLEAALRVALSARLPSLGGLPLHAAGLVLEEAGWVFFGPSGAGKSTLPSLAPGPVFSDEFVAVTLDPGSLRATGFWGEMDGGKRAPVAAPLLALVELARGESFRLERLPPETALRRLLGVLLVPPLPRACSDAMALAGRLAREMPVHRTEWTPAVLPWDDPRAASRPQGRRRLRGLEDDRHPVVDRAFGRGLGGGGPRLRQRPRDARRAARPGGSAALRVGPGLTRNLRPSGPESAGAKAVVRPPQRADRALPVLRAGRLP